MKKCFLQRGFTIVELIIVIAVIGVLAAILIPTFSKVIEKANFANQQSTVKNMNTAVISETEGAVKNTALTFEQAIGAVIKAGFSEEAVKPNNNNYDIVWLGQVGVNLLNRFALVSIDAETHAMIDVLYPKEAVAAVDAMPQELRDTYSIQSISTERKDRIYGCDWNGTEYICLSEDETLTSTQQLLGTWHLDLNGHVIDMGNTSTLRVLGSITICDSVGTGKIISSGAQLQASGGGKITINNGTLITTSNANSILTAGVLSRPTMSNAQITINGGTVMATGGAPAINVYCKDAQLNVYGGEIIAENDYCISSSATAGRGGTKINIYGGSMTSTDSAAINHPQDGELTISGGVITSVCASSSSTAICDAIHVGSGKINISGGTIASRTHALADAPHSNGNENVGAALCVVSSNSFSGDTAVTISGGRFSSAEGYAFAQVFATGSTAKVVGITISGGAFVGNGTKAIFVTEGTNATISITNITANVEGLS